MKVRVVTVSGVTWTFFTSSYTVVVWGLGWGGIAIDFFAEKVEDVMFLGGSWNEKGTEGDKESHSMGPKNNSQTMTKKTKRSDYASSDNTDDAFFFSSVVRHSGWQSCSQITSFAQHTNNEPTMVVRSLSIFKCATSAVRTLLSSSCDASEPSYTKQNFMTNRLGPLQHPSSSKQKKTAYVSVLGILVWSSVVLLKHTLCLCFTWVSVGMLI